MSIEFPHGGGPAFPAGRPYNGTIDEGMTLLDYFAGEAMKHTPREADCIEDAAEFCYSFAEAMLRERNRRLSPGAR